MTDIQCIKWQKRCERQWEDLEEVSYRVRFCSQCNHAVHRAESMHELQELAQEGKCAAYFEDGDFEELGFAIDLSAVVETDSEA